MKLDARTVQSFVEQSDALGGPGSAECNAFWKDMLYEPDTSTDARLDPRSPKYLEQQLALYQEITGREYSEASDEATGLIPIAELLNAPNAYNQASALEYARHCVAMGLLVGELGLARGARILELGSGWGFTQEFLAACGYETNGVEINPNFVETSNARLERLGFGRRVFQGAFSNYDPAPLPQYEAIIAYEAFHHAVDTEAVMRKFTEKLGPSGQFALVAEPFNDYYPTWGLRRDPMSVYCVRKYGWFESGWSVNYMAYLLGAAGMEARHLELGINEFTRYMIGRRSNRLRPMQLGFWRPDIADGWIGDWVHCWSRGSSPLMFDVPVGVASISLDVENFDTSPMAVDVFGEGVARVGHILPPGRHTIEVATPVEGVKDHVLRIESGTFSPADSGINDDQRRLGVYLHGLERNPSA